MSASPSPSPRRRSPTPPPPVLQRHKRKSPPLVKTPLKKKGSHKTNPPPEKLPYEKSKEESEATAQKDLDAFWKTIKDACEAKRNPPKPHFALPRQELRRKVIEREKLLHERRKPLPLLDYECSLNKSYKAS